MDRIVTLTVDEAEELGKSVIDLFEHRNVSVAIMVAILKAIVNIAEANGVIVGECIHD